MHYYWQKQDVRARPRVGMRNLRKMVGGKINIGTKERRGIKTLWLYLNVWGEKNTG